MPTTGRPLTLLPLEITMLGSLRAATTLPRVRLSAAPKVAPALRALSSSSVASQAAPTEPPKMVKLTVNGKEVEVEQGYVFRCF